MATIIELYSEYHRKKWFPDKYPDPFAELVDYLNESAIHDLVQSSKIEKNRGLLQIAFELSKLLPPRKFPDLYRDCIQVYQESLSPANCRPEFCYFHLRKLSNEQRTELWSNLMIGQGEINPECFIGITPELMSKKQPWICERN